jgi:hypothetical protein
MLHNGQGHLSELLNYLHAGCRSLFCFRSRMYLHRLSKLIADKSPGRPELPIHLGP